MIKKPEDVIKDLLECQIMLEKQIEAYDIIIDSKNQQIELLKEKTAFLEDYNKKLSENMKQLAIENKHLEETCMKQQILLEECTEMME